jgi:hypothetical protein
VPTGEDGDGSPLGDATLAAGRRTAPRVTINAHATETDRRRVKRVAFGFRRFQHDRIRSLLYAGAPNWTLLPTIRPR